ncbi:MAG: hypothetical protein WCE61_14820 [Candidatus Acidiferrum sp.]
MTNNKIIRRERQEVPKLIDAALLIKGAAGQERETRVVVHHNTLGVIPGLHRKMGQFLDQLSDSFTTQMRSAGIDIGRVQISWRPMENEQDAYEKLTRSRLVLELQQLPVS